MKIRDFKRFTQDDFRTADQWFYDFLDSMNEIIDTLNPLLHGGIDTENMQAEQQTVTLSHGVPVTIKLQKMKSQPFFVRVGHAKGYVGVGAITNFFPDGTFQVTVHFVGTIPTAPVATMLVFE